VNEKEADRLTGYLGWEYCAKSEWKKINNSKIKENDSSIEQPATKKSSRKTKKTSSR
jgi:hypothetical protein